MARTQASTPEPVYGMSRISSSSCTVPSSPSRPCIAMKATSGDASRSRWIRSRPTSSATTSWPSRSSASSTRAPERSDTCRSSERPPFSTATLLTSPPPAASARDRLGSGSTSSPAVASARRRLVDPHRLVLPGERAVELDLLGHDLADAADALADRVLVGAGEVQPHRVAPAAVEERRLARDEGHVVAQRAGEQVGRVDEVRQRGPDEQAAGRDASTRPGAGSGRPARRASCRAARGRPR